ncbi:Anaphase-promoting complex subunit 8 [Abeliophyllum distichum]|uniref:Anaphase-promoting complex subunit 8 n=1 Tax=Abeliophyllum distichum TaxID=126358 RepID=A0ABD1VQ76_9LAMI
MKAGKRDLPFSKIDSFGLYVYGLILKEKGSENLVRIVLVESINGYPCNWSACSELQSLCTSIDTLNSLDLNNHWMKDFFLASTFQELRMHTESLAKYILAQIAKAQYSLDGI